MGCLVGGSGKCDCESEEDGGGLKEREGENESSDGGADRQEMLLP
jgi:hypothetical protein